MKQWFITNCYHTASFIGAFSANIAMVVPQNSTLTNYLILSSFLLQQVKKIHEIVHNYLTNNLAVLVGAPQSLQKQIQNQRKQYIQKAIKQHVQKLFNNSIPPVDNAKDNVTLVKFFYYQCKNIAKL